jgi:hypothetical protein
MRAKDAEYRSVVIGAREGGRSTLALGETKER